MAIDYDRLLALDIPAVEQRYSERDTILYALGVGVAHDPVDPDILPFVYEKHLRALPTMALVLAHPGFWSRDLDTGIDWVKMVHGEQSMVLHRDLAPAGTVTGKTRVVEIIDKGAGKGAIVISERRIVDTATGEPIATLTQVNVCRGDGGFGGPPRAAPVPPTLPDRTPDLVVDLPTRPEAALVYRLSADPNPLHADPAVARAAGFPRPILHGLATFGVVGHAILKGQCGYDPARIGSMSGRFSAPVFPGETIRTEMWRDGDIVAYRARVVERDAIVLNNGRVVLRDQAVAPVS
jgi:acyl dehydratase